MPASFKFVNNKTQEIAILANIDNEIASFLGQEPDKEVCLFMDPVAEIGIWVLMKSGGGFVTKEAFDSFMEAVKKNNPNGYANTITEKHMQAMRKFLYEDYTFHAWR